MDRILSARIDDAVYREITNLSQKMHASKKSVIEQAIELLGRTIRQEGESDIFDETCGVWERTGSSGDTVKNVRTAFNTSMSRHAR